ncbi:2-succinyl-6-hydroxy-2,4-cyclohexadiene-1-carboxylate synthase [Vibrio xiamenensis]|uniref:Putative 2-succinyl-6-hydroxy-2,4-cyclohexadiene-1-carboxylate synthase n=1 Tax=Vibrio xiamenensis TaxID=861298 RepID=A0A1G7Y4K6_9VIBR|nr:2-succinyl-6-hydroxy-2,4-cyclohexadiene-1-carboxylate synthase [Vibrio xiamenensis]SDG91287.1 2-succinyl-6-hydroxy-2,4-cyclohexadiene-1-carboxylate synthase [Vibrio xiamenensis]
MLFSHYHASSSDSQQPVVVFLHGLLGSGEDWQGCLEALDGVNCLTIDLPGHGNSHAIDGKSFDHCCELVVQSIQSKVSRNTPILLVGYSLGARIAMYGAAFERFNTLNLRGLLIEGGNFGLTDEAQKNARWQHDSAWAQRFKNEPIGQVLDDWYQQAVFSSLNYAQRQTLVEKRSANLGAAIANMLLSTSLAKQPYLLTQLAGQKLAAHYICGIKDTKFSAMAEHSGLSFSQVKDAGHNVHHEQPKAFANLVLHHLQAVSEA